MLQSFAQSHDWFYSEPLLFDDDFCQSLMKDLQSLPTPPQSPPTKAAGAAGGGGEPLSSGDQLSFVSDILLEDHDMQLNWNCAFLHSDDDGGGGDGGGGRRRRPSEEESGEDGLWRRLTSEKTPEEKPASSVLGSSPLLSDMDTGIFEGLAGSTLDCHDLMESRESAEATSDYCSTGGEMSTYSSSDSEEEIDVVTVGRRPSSPSPDLPSPWQKRRYEEEEAEERRALRRHHLEIQLQHNYAAPRPASPPPPHSYNKRPRGGHFAASSPPARHQPSSRHSAEAEDEEERRRTHNVMERQRRNELKNCFVRLRDNIPELSRNDKASKVVILKKATDCIRGLEGNAHRLQVKRDQLRARQEELKALLQRLRTPARS
ncbi:myelocytomatosis oncogene homolog [Syngnathoides biaculeatus]|uniref:myelocytomatosis oncogene homolog n=1 Tax=Syngnathoides biaculeatus TaxID=300417 RepID=UPI002ADE5155|nr:myelocytomatosis oncogene homolog [Syngnathoides biaculeatus]